jgi:hypothetical protein
MKSALKLLEKYSSGFSIEGISIPDTDLIQKELTEKRLAALATGDTIETFNRSSYSGISTTIITPLIAYSDEEINVLLDKIR